MFYSSLRLVYKSSLLNLHRRLDYLKSQSLIQYPGSLRSSNSYRTGIVCVSPMSKFEKFKITGSVAAPFTPFNDNGDIEHGLVDTYVKYLLDHHFDNAFVNGTLGEGMSMTVEERKKMAEVWKKATDGKMKMILHVGANNLKDTCELARHAQEIGVDAIAALCPSFFKPETEEILVEYMSRVAGEAPDIPFYYYCINFMTGAKLNATRFLELGKDRIPNLCGVKYSSGDLRVAHCLTMVDRKRFQILIGTDVQFLEALVLGIGVPISACYIGDIFHNLKQCYDRGDFEEARKYQRQAQALSEIRAKYGGGFDVAKTIFSIVSGLGGCGVRLPLTPLSKDQKDNIRKDLEDAGILH